MTSVQRAALPHTRPDRRPVWRLAAAAAAASLCVGAQAAGSTPYLQSLLDATPAGGWVQANLNLFSSVWVTDPSLKPPQGQGLFYDPASVVFAWSSVAWDSTRNNLMLWGGGHASHSGNEMYIWNGTTGTWSLGSLPSKIVLAPDSTYPVPANLVIDNAAPQASHTYESNLYLPLNDRFITFGGPAYNDAQGFTVRDANGNLVKAGPWLYDPSKADGTKVGGTDGSGWNPATLGGNMWENRRNVATGVAPAGFVNNTTAYRTENGHDVVYLTDYSGGGGFPALYRYTVGNLAAGEGDKWELVGKTALAPSFQASGTIDDAHGLYVHTVSCYTCTNYDLNVWDLSKSGEGNIDKPINLTFADGTAFVADITYAVEYDSIDGSLYLWNGDKGKVYRTKATYNADGTLATTWQVDLLLSTTSAQPGGNFRYGVLGKWQYVKGLNAFVALDEYTSAGDAGVWFYKPSDVTTAVPEAGTLWTMLGGLGVVGALARRRRNQGVARSQA